MQRLKIKIDSKKTNKIKEYGGAGAMHGTYLDPFIAVKDSEVEDFKSLMIKEAFYSELENQEYICPICGQTEHKRHSRIACCGSIKEALADYKRSI